MTDEDGEWHGRPIMGDHWTKEMVMVLGDCGNGNGSTCSMEEERGNQSGQWR